MSESNGKQKSKIIFNFLLLDRIKNFSHQIRAQFELIRQMLQTECKS